MNRLRKSLLSQSSTSSLRLLREREYQHRRTFRRKLCSVQSVHNRLNKIFNGVPSIILSLTKAIDSGNINDVESEISSLVNKLFETSTNVDAVFAITSSKRQEREVFVILDGVNQLLRLFQPPFCGNDPRTINTNYFHNKSEFWNEILVILREISFTIPSLADNLFCDEDISFLFTSLSHSSIFDNAINLLEEILAIRSETFLLGNIPNVYSLLQSLSVRQLAHFCRVLSLLLFEPEDRQIMEGSHSLRSLELLQLRRDRMYKMSSKVEKNQFLILECPGLFDRLALILRIMNYGPKLSEQTSFNIPMQTPLASEIFHFITASGLSSEGKWEALKRMEEMVRTEDRNRIRSSYTGRSPRRRTGQLDVELNNRLLETFSSIGSETGMDLNSVFRILEIARDIGINAELGPSLRSNLHEDSSEETSLFMEMATLYRFASDENPSVGRGSANRSNSRRSNRLGRSEHSSPMITPDVARKQLQFYAMLLLPHQVEVLFVMCSALSGRKKIAVQKKLHDLNFSEIFLDMYDRLSWDEPTFQAVNPYNHIHGPTCECNPESALRVQYLRLVHNYYDRDFLYNENKSTILSKNQIIHFSMENNRLVESLSSDNYVSNESSSSMMDDWDQSLLTKLIATFLSEPCDSMYRFWLSSCLEAFLRGNKRSYEQIYIARRILSNIMTNILNIGIKPTFNLQTAFDLLGELIKWNEITVQMMNEFFQDESSFQLFMNIVMNNLVDSNVFVRTLYMTFESISEHMERKQIRSMKQLSEGMPLSALGAKGYLTDSWLPFSPQSKSKLGTQIFAIAESSATTKHSSRMIASPRSKVSKDRLTAGNNRSRTGSSQALSESLSMASLTDGLKEAFIGIRDAANQLLTTASMIPSSMTTTAESIDAIDGTVTDSLTHSNDKAIANPTNSVEEDDPSTAGDYSYPFPWSMSGSDSIEEDRRLTTDANASPPRISIPPPLLLTTRFASDEMDESDFVTPPEQPKYSRHWGIAESSDAPPKAIKQTIQHHDSFSNGSAVRLMSYTSIGSGDIDDQPGTKAADQELHRQRGWQFPDNLFRIAYFLTNEREMILLRLMSTITLRNINHENICCLNTALLILLFGYQRGQLDYILMKIRVLAAQSLSERSTSMKLFDDSNDVPIDSKSEELLCSLCLVPRSVQANDRASTQRDLCGSCLSSSAALSSGQPLHGCGVDGSAQSFRRSLRGDNAPRDAYDLPVFKTMKNFRELLWFWREYYLRRGRDRLSIEFSSRIPFLQWQRLVEILCSDDGTPTSLLPHPISLPRSPYSSRLQVMFRHHERNPHSVR